MSRGVEKADVPNMLLINQVAQEVGLSQKRIREYEAEGFIKPRRDKNTNNRLYSQFEVDQIKRINHLIHQRGFTLACLRNLLVLAPCWNIFGCAERGQCAAFNNPHRSCWQVRREIDTKCPGPCRRCAVYLVRETKRRKVLEPSDGRPFSAKE